MADTGGPPRYQREGPLFSFPPLYFLFLLPRHKQQLLHIWIVCNTFSLWMSIFSVQDILYNLCFFIWLGYFKYELIIYEKNHRIVSICIRKMFENCNVFVTKTKLPITYYTPWKCNCDLSLSPPVPLSLILSFSPSLLSHWWIKPQNSNMRAPTHPPVHAHAHLCEMTSIGTVNETVD